MTARFVIDAPATRERLTASIEAAQPHLKPVLTAVRDFCVGMFFVGQSAQPFRLPSDPMRPAIIIIGDDFDRAVGPDGFHMPSIRRAIRSCTAFAVVSAEPMPIVYATSASAAALTRRNTMIIETRPEQEIAWVALVQKLAPGRPVMLATVEGGHA